jgi:hypothetical protein
MAANTVRIGKACHHLGYCESTA